MPDKIFVYGTLRSGDTNHYIIEQLVQFVTPAKVKGTLYSLGQYPAMIAGDQWITGELISFHDMDEAFKRMDELEYYYGPGNANNEYERLIVQAQKPDGTLEDCFTYLYAKPADLHRAGILLKHGDWSIQRY